MKSRWNDFQSPLAQGIKAYLASNRALGKQFKSEEEAMRLSAHQMGLDAYC
jgi:hypothetical protein